MQNFSEIYLSIVLAVRNDNYGGDFSVRLQNMLNWTIFFLEKHAIASEIILVNYNPIPDSPEIKDFIPRQGERKNVSIRILTVSPEIHNKLYDPSVRQPVPLYEYIAKNTGILRARGEYILSANPDILIHPAIFKWLAGKKTSMGTYYRANRCDYSAIDAFLPGSENKYLAKIRENIFRVFLQGATYEVKAGSFNTLRYMMTKWENNRLIRRNDWLLQHQEYAKRKSIPLIYDNLVHHYHCNCSGDFMLMHRKHWMDLKGYPENMFLAIHTDALFVVMAGVSGLKEFIFRKPVFHQDHARRYSGTDDVKNEEIRRMFRFFIEEGEYMARSGKVKEYNSSDWGLKNETITEETL